MKNKLSLLLAGALTLSILLTACTTQGADPAPGPANTPSPSPSTEPIATPSPTPGPSAKAAASTPEPTGESSLQTAEPAAAVSEPPQDSVQTPAPAVGTPKPAVSTPAPAVSNATADAPPLSTAPQLPAEPSPDPTPTPTAPTATREAAMAYIGRSAASMIAAIGPPIGMDYAPSCLGDGEDGELFYNGFTVYTYRDGNSETVQDVI